MGSEGLYKFNTPERFLNCAEALPGRSFSVYKEAAQYRQMWIASRFCYGFSEFKNRKHEVRLVEGDEEVFELKRGEDISRFLVKEIDEEAMAAGGLPEAINACIPDKSEGNAAGAYSLVIFTNTPSADFNDKTIEEIATGLRVKAPTLGGVWVLARAAGTVEETFYLTKVYPEKEPFYLFEVKKISPVSRLFSWILMVSLFLAAFILLWQFYSVTIHSTEGWGVSDFFKVYRLNPSDNY